MDMFRCDGAAVNDEYGFQARNFLIAVWVFRSFDDAWSP
jgi:hypothetical protein